MIEKSIHPPPIADNQTNHLGFLYTSFSTGISFITVLIVAVSRCRSFQLR